MQDEFCIILQQINIQMYSFVIVDKNTFLSCICMFTDKLHIFTYTRVFIYLMNNLRLKVGQVHTLYKFYHRDRHASNSFQFLIN